MGRSCPIHGRPSGEDQGHQTIYSCAKNIVSIPIESISTSIVILVEFVCDRVSIPIESIPIKFVKNSTPYNIISAFTYVFSLNMFISEINKETFNIEELKQGHVEPIKEETQSVNLGTDDESKMV